MPRTSTKERLGIQSIEVGVRLLRVLATHGHPMMLRDLAQAAGMPAAKAHRYLVSFQRTGLVEQDTASGRYGLGAFALDLGLASLSRLDPVRLAGPFLEELCEQIGDTVALAVWGTHGATIVRLDEPGGPITVTLRPGTALNLFNSATGRAFAAFMNTPHLQALLDEELNTVAQQSGAPIASLRNDYEQVLNEARQQGLARANGIITLGINGFSATVFDSMNKMIAAITALGPVGMFDCEWDSKIAKAIKEAATALSRRLGHTTTEAA